jgi:hypothetical protein
VTAKLAHKGFAELASRKKKTAERFFSRSAAVSSPKNQ